MRAKIFESMLIRVFICSDHYLPLFDATFTQLVNFIEVAYLATLKAQCFFL